MFISMCSMIICSISMLDASKSHNLPKICFVSLFVHIDPIQMCNQSPVSDCFTFHLRPWGSFQRLKHLLCLSLRKKQRKISRIPHTSLRHFMSTETEGKSLFLVMTNDIQIHQTRIGEARKNPTRLLNSTKREHSLHCRSLLLPLRTRFPPAKCFTDIEIKWRISAGCQLQSTNLWHKCGRSVLLQTLAMRFPADCGSWKHLVART